jgi:hypothetical protein
MREGERADYYVRGERDDSRAIDMCKAMLRGTGYVIAGSAWVNECGAFWHYSIPVLKVSRH